MPPPHRARVLTALLTLAFALLAAPPASGQSCDISVEKTCVVVPPPSAGDDCQGKVLAAVFEYTGADCAVPLANAQGGKAECQGSTGGGPAMLHATKDADKIDIAPSGAVAPGALFTVSASDEDSDGELGSKLELEVDAASQQQLEIHTSCSKPLAVGDVFGSLRLVELSTTQGGTVTLPPPPTPAASCTVPTPPAAPHCLGKVERLGLRYRGGDCTATTNAQEGKVVCTGDAGASEPVRIVVRDSAGGSKLFLDTGEVADIALGDVVEAVAAHAGENELKSDTYVEIQNASGAVLQSVKLHSSCSKPLDLGDRMGGLEIFALDPTQGPAVSLGAEVEYAVTITNHGTAPTAALSVIDDRLGELAGSPLGALAPGASATLTADAVLTDSTINTVGVGDAFSTGGTCLATAAATVILGGQAPAAPDLAISIDSPLAAATLGAQPVVVTGTVTGTQPVAVTVNGLVATVVGNRFIAAGIPLAPGLNPLAATATDASGSASDTVDVIFAADGSDPATCQLSVEKTCLFAPPEETGDDCDGKVVSAVFEYTGESCLATSHDQGSAATCAGDPAAAAPVAVAYTGGDPDKIDVFPAAEVLAVSDRVTVAATGRPELKSETLLEIRQGAQVLQALELHTSCSKPLAVGDQFGALQLVELTTTEGGTVVLPDPPVPAESCAVPDPPPGPHCTGKIEVLSLRYLGGDCGETTNPQDGKVECTGAGDPGAPVRLIVKDKSDGSKIFFDSGTASIETGSVVNATAASGGENELGSDSFVEIQDATGTVLQTVKLHTSCSKPLDMGDRLGALEVFGIDTKEEAPVSLGAAIDYAYVVTNQSAAPTGPITLVDNQLGAVPGSPVARIASGETVTLTAQAFLAGSTANTVAVAGALAAGGGACMASDLATVLLPGDPLPGEPPEISIATPSEGELLGASPVLVRGPVAGTTVSVDVNGVVASVAGGEFEALVPLVAGVNTILATATNALGTATDTITVTLGALPTIAIDAPADGLLTAVSPVTVTITATDADTVTVNGVVAVPVGATFSADVPLAEGSNTLTATATNPLGSANASVSVTLDTMPPVVTIDSPLDGSTFTAEPITILGTVSDASAITALTVNGIAVTAGTSFSESVALVLGPNTITVAASDAAGNVGSASITLTLEPPPLLAISIAAPGDGSVSPTAAITVTGSLSDGSAAVSVNGVAASLTGTTFSANITLASGPNFVTATATRGLDTASDEIVVAFASDPVPPPPVLVPSAIDPTVATDFASSTEFLYTGPGAVQTGITPGIIEAQRAAVLRGEVRSVDDEPLPSVRVFVVGHPEYGETLTRADGFFDLAVNGGGHLTLRYERVGGYLPATRTVEVPWRDFTVAPDVVMLLRDPTVSFIDLSPVMVATTDPIVIAQAATGFQIAQGSVTTDSRGSRQVTLLVPDGAVATAEIPQGQDQVLEALSIRATEFSKLRPGRAALNQLPGTLNEGQFPGFVFNLSADEAVSLGASRVAFNQPLPLYVENFLGEPTGTDLALSNLTGGDAWIDQTPGKAVTYLGTGPGGEAQVDTNGDGQADSSGDLAAAGITPGEAAELPGLFPPGTSLLRFAIQFLLDWCSHKPAALPPGAMVPGQPQADDPPCEGCECETKPGSDIQVERQCFSERIDLVGSPFDLHYKSDRVPGNKAADTIDIPVADNDLPTSVEQIELHVQVAGRRFEILLPALPNQTFPFTWDRKDAYGRTLQGRQPIRTELRYVYTPLNGGAGTGVRTSLRQFYESFIGAWDNRSAGVGGWTLTPHHAYDPYSQTLFRGDGSRRSGGNLPPVTETIVATGGGSSNPASFHRFQEIAIAPDNTIYATASGLFGGEGRVFAVAPDGAVTVVAGGGTSTQDGIPATSARVASPRGIALAPDGSVYFSDQFQDNNKVRRVAPDGTIHTFAGTGLYDGVTGSTGDGGPAIDARLQPGPLVAAPDGSLYVVDAGRVRKIDPEGIITTVAGNGLGGFGPLDVPATEAAVSTPRGLALDRDGRLYMAIQGFHRVASVGVDGILRLEAGNGQGNQTLPPGDGGPAVDAILLNPVSVAVAPDGSLYIVSQQGGQRLRRVTPDGLISTVSGTGAIGFTPDGEPAARSRLNTPNGVVVDQEGDVLLADGSNVLRRIRSPLPGFATGDFLVASAGGSEIYRFDAAGRHLETLDAITRTALLTFTYTAAGTLDAMTDADGNVTRVLRDGSGNPTDIEAPFGQQTALVLDSNGYLASATNPAGEAFTLLTGPEGLLDEFRRPTGDATSFTYDPLGRLTRDADAAGGFLDLVRSDTAFGSKVTATTAEGRVDDAGVDFLVTGEKERIRTDAAGLVTTIVDGLDAVETTTTPDGTLVSRTEGPDPRFGLAAPIQTELAIDTPGGLSFLRTQTRTATVDQTTGDLLTQTDAIAVNGRQGTVAFVFDPGTGERSVTTTTAEGRLRVHELDGQGRLVETQVDGLEAVQLSYDAAGRPSTLAQGQGAQQRLVSFAYDVDGNLDTVTDPLLRTVSFDYNLANRVTRQTLPDGRFIDFTYDANGNLTSLTPPGQPAHVFRYTTIDQEAEYEPPPVTTSDPRTFFSYDLDKNLIQVDRPDGKQILVGYDTAGRLETITTSRGATNQTYNPVTGNVSTINAPGGEGLGFGYDGSLVTSTAWSGTVAGSVSQSYDDDFRVETQSVNAGFTETFAYDDDGLLVGAGAVTLTRDPLNGLPTGTTLGTVTTTQSYNTFGELETNGASAGSTALYANTYTRDALGRIAQKVETIQGVTTTTDYGYDLAGRLETVTIDGVLTRTYAYDANGNRLSVTDVSTGVTSGTYDAQDRLLTYGTTTYSHNEAGDLTSKTDSSLPAGQQTTTYSYDSLGNLISINLPNGSFIEYVIDGRNRRVGKRVDGILMQGWLYQDRLNPVAELDGTGNVIARFVYGSRPNVPDYIVKGGSTHRVLGDHLGSPRLMVDAATGAIAQRLDYDEFGEVLQDSNPGLQPFGFAGGLYDADTGLTRFGARDYDPAVGRWSAKDPIRLEGGLNLYGYVLNDPVNLVDPSGLDVNIVITRTGTTPTSVAGTFNASSTVTGGSVSGHTLENPNPPNPNLPVSPGSYSAHIDSRAGRTDRIELNNVANASDVQLHIGNTAGDVVGCFAVGSTAADGFVGDSANAMNALLNLIAADGTGDIAVTVVGSGNSSQPAPNSSQAAPNMSLAP